MLVAGYAIKSGLPASSAEAFVGTFLTTPTKIASIPGVTLEVIDGAKLGAQWAYAEGLSLVW